MLSVFEKDFRTLVTALLGFFLLLLAPAQAQHSSDPARLAELRRLRDQIEVGRGFADADVVVIIGQRILTEAAQQLVGLEIVLSNGSTIRVTSVESELKTASVLVKIGLQAKSSITVNLQLLGKIHSGELDRDVLRMPIEVTDVKLGNGLFSSLLIKTLLGNWLKPETWNDELPAIELPVELGEKMQFPARRFETSGEMPVEISTPAFETALKFSLDSFLILNNRAVLALNLAQNKPVAIKASFAGSNHNDPAALESEIEQMTQHLHGGGDLRIRLGRRVISQLLEQIAAAQVNDFDIRLKHGRLRTEEVTAIVKITNYTDVESGQGQADISRLAIDRIADGAINLRMSGKGEIDARLRGREYGIPYAISPRIAFEIKEQPVPLQLASEGDRAFLRAQPGTSFPINLRIMTQFAGRDLGFDRTVMIQADKWLNQIELPAIFGRDISLPSKMEIDAGGNLYTTGHRKLKYTMRNLRMNLMDDVLDLSGDVKLTSP